MLLHISNIFSTYEFIRFYINRLNKSSESDKDICRFFFLNVKLQNFKTFIKHTCLLKIKFIFKSV